MVHFNEGDLGLENESLKPTQDNNKLKRIQKIGHKSKKNASATSSRGSTKKGGGSARRRSFGEVDPLIRIFDRHSGRSRCSGKQKLDTQPNDTLDTNLEPLDLTVAITASSSSSSCSSLGNIADDSNVSSAEMDSWSSVVEQPSCPLCQVTFDNQYKLERHIKYSNLHATSLKQQKEKETQLIADCEEKLNPKSPTPQEEGIDYKQLYSGDKLFWRTKTTLEIRLYLHLSTEVIEVAGYDKTDNAPTNRLYLNHNVLLNVIEEMAMKAVDQRKKEIKEKQKEARKRRIGFNEATPSDEVMLNEAKRVVLVTHILDRLQIDLNDGKDKPNIVFIPIVKIADDVSDTEDIDVSDDSPATSCDIKNQTMCESKILLKDLPMDLRPVYIAWRRYSSIDECVEVRNHLETGIKDLAVASEKADRLTKLIFTTTAGLGAIAERYKKMRNMGYSKWRIKWIWATKRIIIQKDVARYTKLLTELGYVV